MQRPDDLTTRDMAGAPARAKPRQERLKAALKANMARRKAQVRARSGDPADGAADADKHEDE